jgi:hypothetical protein
MDHYTVLHFGTCFIAWRALVHPPTADRHQPTHHAPAISSSTFEPRTAALRLNSCDPLPPCRPAGAINCVWTTYLGNYHNCSTLDRPDSYPAKMTTNMKMAILFFYRYGSEGRGIFTIGNAARNSKFTPALYQLKPLFI